MQSDLDRILRMRVSRIPTVRLRIYRCGNLARPSLRTHRTTDRCSTRTRLMLNTNTGEVRYWYCGYEGRCPRCAERYMRDVRRRLDSQTWGAMVTLTMPPNRRTPNQENIASQSHAIKLLMRKLKKRSNTFQYAWVRELGEDGDNPASAPILDIALGGV
jgi:hypothetical protein